MIRVLWIAVSLFVLVCMGYACQAIAIPPPNADPALSPWFNSLHAPDGTLCCSISDCRPVKARVKDGHWQAWIGQQFRREGETEIEEHWETVPDERITKTTNNPTGEPIACWIKYTTPNLICFVPPPEA